MPKKDRKKILSTERKRASIKKFTGFFAYPNHPEDKAKIIEKAIALVNSGSDCISITGWKDMDKRSPRIISNILESIQKSDFFIADISGLNPNVLFEAGYAFGNKKTVCLVSQGCSSNDFDHDKADLHILSSWDISRFQNTSQLVEEINKRNFSKTNPISEFEKLLASCSQSPLPNKALFLKASCKHEIALAALDVIKAKYDQCMIDDWDENPCQGLLWYIKALCHSNSVLSLFIPASWDNAKQMNSRFSFICGIALALNKLVRLVALPGYDPPIDYQEIMIRPHNDSQIRQILSDEFSLEVHSAIPVTQAPHGSKVQEIQLSKVNKEIVFLEINIGDSVAENEEHNLESYFIPTGQYYQAIKKRQAIIVGNKGTGKTAMFYQLRSYFQKDKRNLVCEIKPPDYKMTRFLEALNLLPEVRVGHIFDTVWKLVIYSELLLSLYRRIEHRAISVGYSTEEQALIQFFHKHEAIVSAPFEQKLEMTSTWLDEVSRDSDNFSKKLHDHYLIECKNVLEIALKPINQTIILVDNLDKAWKYDANLDQQALLVLSLLGIHRRVSQDLGRDAMLSIKIFLRRNIFEYILDSKITREADKILSDHIELEWSDPETLSKIIEMRFQRALESLSIDCKADIWNDFFVPKVQDVPIKSWLYAHVMPRPRDLIDFVEKSIESAINKDHESILEDDLLSAAKVYPSFALEQLITEFKAEQPWLQVAIVSFRSKPNKWLFRDILEHINLFLGSAMSTHNITNREILAALIGVGFIGVQKADAISEYAISVDKSRIYRTIVLNHPIEAPLYLCIHPIFFNYLDTQEATMIDPVLHTEISDPQSEVNAQENAFPFVMEKIQRLNKRIKALLNFIMK